MDIEWKMIYILSAAYIVNPLKCILRHITYRAPTKMIYLYATLILNYGADVVTIYLYFGLWKSVLIWSLLIIYKHLKYMK